MSKQPVVRVSATWKAVKEMYEAYPYPSPIVGDSVIDDVANCLYSLYGDESLDGWRILDAGCGTGQRLVGAARRYPGAQFVGIDMTDASLAVAERLAKRHAVNNLHLERGNLLDLDLSGMFDLVISTGVIHHLEEPQRGIQNLAYYLAPKGLLVIWLYNSLGEHDRLLGRELLHLMWNAESGVQRGVQMMRDLGLQLEVKRYGSSAAQRAGEVSQLNIDVDAYIHPIVNAYTFQEAIAMLRGCSELGWAAINNINLVDTSKLIDLAEASNTDVRYFCQSNDDLFDNEVLRQRFREMGNIDKLRVMEIKLRPTGFTVIAGRQTTYNQLGPRLVGNALVFE
jgi:SAM-dependent methyltransferase